MAASLLNNSRRICCRLVKADCVNLSQTRTTYKYSHKGYPPGIARTWKERKEAIERILPEEDMAVNIGLPVSSQGTKLTRKVLRKMKTERNLEELERKSRLNELIVPVDEVLEEGFEGLGQQSIHRLADHYGIYRDLFGDAYFYPQLQLRVGYDVQGEDDMVNPVFHGNKLLPAETSRVPSVHYKGDASKFYTVCMTAADSHLEDNNKEYLHWMIGNIPGDRVKDGQVICDYLPVFPVKGTGYHRYVFVLYQQEKTLDFSKEQRSENCTSLRERTFSTLEFYREHQDDITPVGLCFFQSQWDETVRDMFHSVLEMDEPRFEFLPPQPYVPLQYLWPIREPFNVYMDRYRDVKDIGEEVLREKLRSADPFKPRPPPRKYPNLYTLPKDTPSWLRIKLNEQKLKKSYWKGLDD